VKAAACCLQLTLLQPTDGDTLHHDRLNRVVTLRPDLGDLHSNIHAIDDLAKHRVLAGAAREPIEPCVVSNVEEKLAAARVGPAGVGHGQGSWGVGVLRDVLVLDVSSVGARLSFAILQVLECAIRGATSTGAWALGILRVWATKLVHEAGNDTMEMKAVVEATLREIDEVGCGARNAVQVQLC